MALSEEGVHPLPTRYCTGNKGLYKAWKQCHGLLVAMEEVQN